MLEDTVMESCTLFPPRSSHVLSKRRRSSSYADMRVSGGPTCVGVKATMMKALTEKVGDSSGSHSHYTAAGAAAERIVSDPRQYGETTTTLALTKSNDVGSPNRTGMWGAKFLQLSEARTSVVLVLVLVLVRCSVVWCAVCVMLFCARAVLWRDALCYGARLLC